MAHRTQRLWLLAAAAVLLALIPSQGYAQDADFDNDGNVDCDDADILIGVLFFGDPEVPGLDLDMDGFLTALDLGQWFDICLNDEPFCHAAFVDFACITTAFYVAASVYLEGPFAGGQMSTTLAMSGRIPNHHPFSGDPWAYAGGDSVGTVADSVVDWVKLGLWFGDPLSPPLTLKAERAALLLRSGAIVDTSGSGPVYFGVSPDSGVVFPRDFHPIYLVVDSRNHLSVMSSDTLTLDGGVAEWDFRSAAGQSFSSGGDAVKALPGGKYGLFACDVDADGHVTAPDFNFWNASTTAGETGYLRTDCNLDGHVTAPDFNLWNANTVAGAASQVPG
jgi:hypothetical protein